MNCNRNVSHTNQFGCSYRDCDCVEPCFDSYSKVETDYGCGQTDSVTVNDYSKKTFLVNCGGQNPDLVREQFRKQNPAEFDRDVWYFYPGHYGDGISIVIT